MRIFELHFNQPAEIKLGTTTLTHSNFPERIFDSYCYEPINVYEKRMGNLCLVGELTHALPQDARLLDNLAEVIKGKYYVFPLKSPEQSLKESLKRANEFLSAEVKKDNVNWLGNLSFACLAIKNSDLNLTKVGDIKILLLRGGTITDISKNLELGEIEPYPLKVFNNIVSGKLATDDRLLVLTKEAYSAFNRLNPESPKLVGRSLIQEISQTPPFDEKRLKEFLRAKQKILAEISGVCLLIEMTEAAETQGQKVFRLQKEKEKFSLRQAFLPIFKFFSRFSLKIKNTLGGGKSIKKNISQTSNSPRPSHVIPKWHLPKFLIPVKSDSFKLVSFTPDVIMSWLASRNWKKVKKNLFLVGLLLFLLFAGCFIFKEEKQRQFKNRELILAKATRQVSEAETFLSINNEEKATSLLNDALYEILPFSEEEWPKKEAVLTLKRTIEEKLGKIYQLEEISSPELLFEFNQEKFIPQKMVFANGKLYFSSPLSQELFSLNPQTKEQKNYSLPVDNIGGINLMASLGNALALFQKPNKLIVFKDQEFTPAILLEAPYPNFNFTSFTVFQTNLYFFEEKQSKIIKYPSLGKTNWGPPEIWLEDKTAQRTRTSTGSLAVDGIVWVLNRDNTISRYRSGKYQQDIILDFFPSPKKLYKVLVTTSSPYLYLLEPIEKRVIVLEKSGQLIKQFQSDQFDNLKDLAISFDGRTIWLLNGIKIYQVQF